MKSIDLNADLGESFGVYQLGGDEELLQWVSSANIACGFHAGDPAVMRRTVQRCLEKGVAIGAHPGLPDLAGFGRREIQITPSEAFEMVVYQIGALEAIARAEGGKLHHVKPHGALYHMAARNEALAEAIVEAIYRVNPQLILYGLAGSKLILASKRIGLPAASEVFADRTYQQDGSLTPRSSEQAMIHDINLAAEQVLGMVREGKVPSLQGSLVPIVAETVCLHGDGAHAIALAARICSELQKEGVQIAAL